MIDPEVDPAVGWGGGKHEIYVATFGGHFFMTYFYRNGEGGMAPSVPPGSATEISWP